MTVCITEATTSGSMYAFGVPEMGGVVPIHRNGEICLVNKEETTIRLSNLRLRHFAANHMPPQSWYDEDMEGLY